MRVAESPTFASSAATAASIPTASAMRAWVAAGTSARSGVRPRVCCSSDSTTAWASLRVARSGRRSALAAWIFAMSRRIPG